MSGRKRPRNARVQADAPTSGKRTAVEGSQADTHALVRQFLQGNAPTSRLRTGARLGAAGRVFELPATPPGSELAAQESPAIATPTRPVRIAALTASIARRMKTNAKEQLEAFDEVVDMSGDEGKSDSSSPDLESGGVSWTAGSPSPPRSAAGAVGATPAATSPARALMRLDSASPIPWASTDRALLQTPSKNGVQTHPDKKEFATLMPSSTWAAFGNKASAWRMSGAIVRLGVREGTIDYSSLGGRVVSSGEPCPEGSDRSLFRTFATQGSNKMRSGIVGKSLAHKFLPLLLTAFEEHDTNMLGRPWPERDDSKYMVLVSTPGSDSQEAFLSWSGLVLVSSLLREALVPASGTWASLETLKKQVDIINGSEGRRTGSGGASEPTAPSHPGAPSLDLNGKKYTRWDITKVGWSRARNASAAARLRFQRLRCSVTNKEMWLPVGPTDDLRYPPLNGGLLPGELMNYASVCQGKARPKATMSSVPRNITNGIFAEARSEGSHTVASLLASGRPAALPTESPRQGGEYLSGAGSGTSTGSRVAAVAKATGALDGGRLGSGTSPPAAGMRDIVARLADSLEKRQVAEEAARERQAQQDASLLQFFQQSLQVQQPAPSLSVPAPGAAAAHSERAVDAAISGVITRVQGWLDLSIIDGDLSMQEQVQTVLEQLHSGSVPPTLRGMPPHPLSDADKELKVARARLQMVTALKKRSVAGQPMQS